MHFRIDRYGEHDCIIYPVFETISFIKHALFIRVDPALLINNSTDDRKGSWRASKATDAELLHQGNFPAEDLVTLRQIHGTSCIRVGREDASRKKGTDGDCLITADPAIAIAVKTADCFPLIIVNERERVISCVHAGWRGIARGIIEACLCTMSDDFSCMHQNTLCALGPGIEQCCYEVNEDVIDCFRSHHVDVEPFLSQSKGRSFRLSLRGIILDKLHKAGCRKDRIFQAEACSFCSDLHLPSFRRDGNNAQRTLSAIMLV